MENDKVSIIMPTYNRAYILSNAIQSVLKQTYENWELIIIDDASEDETKEIVKKYNDSRIKFILNDKNRGANYGRNIGIKASQGKFIAFLDSDNYWLCDKLQKQVEKISQTDEKTAFVFCQEKVVQNEKETYVPKGIITEIEKVLYETNIIDTSTVLMKRECLDRTGLFDENMPRLQDWELFFRVIVVEGYKCMYINECLNINYIQKNSISQNSKKFIDAIFYFLAKHNDCFTDSRVICNHIRQAIMIAETEEIPYIYHKLEQYAVLNNNCLWAELSISLMEKLNERQKDYMFTYNWLEKKIEKNFVYNNINFQKDGMKIAIYGLGRWGELFYQDLQSFPVAIEYGIDQKVEYFHGLQIKRMDDKLDEVDLLVVTVWDKFSEIKKELQKKYFGKIVSLDELISK